MSSTTITGSLTTITGYQTPTVDVTKRSDGHFLPFAVAVVLFLAAMIASIAVVGLPH